MNSFDLARMLSPKESDALNANFGTIKDFYSDNTVSVLLDGATTPQRISMLRPAGVGSRCAVIQKGQDWFMLPGGNYAMASSRTITCSMSELQGVINNLPKYLAGNVTINVNAGTITGSISVTSFTGPGSLQIVAKDSSGVNVAKNVQTHKCSSVTISQCDNGNQIQILGLTATATSGNCFYINRCSTPLIKLTYCNAVAGVSSTTNFYGIVAEENSAGVHADSCTISNKARAFYSVKSSHYVVSAPDGTDNATVYYENGCVLHISTAGTIGGAKRYASSNGGLIIPPTSLSVVAVSTNKNPTGAWVWRQYSDETAECWRVDTGTATTNTAYASLYRTATQYGQYSFPFTFRERPVLLRKVSNAGAQGLMWLEQVEASASDSGNVFILSGANQSVNWAISQYAKGRVAL